LNGNGKGNGGLTQSRQARPSLEKKESLPSFVSLREPPFSSS
jgi:hypothetical protein